jgi:ATP-binding cassette subfamily B protein
MSAGPSPKRRWLVPEVIQTSAMDCGPAVLKCLLEGFGIPVHYGRLREACQTDVDGTSIDVLEAVAGRLGLAAEQVMLPLDHLLLPEAEALPAILVLTIPSGFTHFVLVWRRHGPLVQVMDPAHGRRWVRCHRLLEEAYVHSQPVPAAAWHDWAVSGGLGPPLARRLRDLGLRRGGTALIEAAAVAPGWRPLARLDAATRLVASLVRSGGLRRGREARGVLDAVLRQAEDGVPGQGQAIPEPCWSALPAPPGPDGEEQLLLRGAVLVRVQGRLPAERGAPGSGPGPTAQGLGPELAAALAGPGTRPGRELFRLVRGAGLLTFLGLAGALTLAAGGTVLEGLFLRGMIEVGRDLGLVQQRLQAVGFFLTFGGLLLLIEYGTAGGLVRLGRRLETCLRLAFLDKIPRLHDRYFHSRPTSDMAERSHVIHHLRLLPWLTGQFVRAALTLLLTAAAIAWIDPGGAPLAALAACTTLALPLALNPFLTGLDLRVRTHAGALSRYYLDALLGLTAVRAHGAERVVRREHESLLVEWAHASQRLLRWVVAVEGVQALAGFGLAGWLLLLHAGRLTDAAGALLLAYWALNLPMLGEEIALLARQYPTHRNVTLRLLEPLGAPEEKADGGGPKAERPAEGDLPDGTGGVAAAGEGKAPGVAITLEGVTVHAGGHTILEDIRVGIEAGAHVAIVGASGAGKSSLVGLLLGWHRAAGGRVLIDGEPLDGARLERLRRETAWVDPAVQVWNRSLLHNLVYGAPPDGSRRLGEVLHEADLYGVLQLLPDGLQTPLGEGGGLLSGGEGQRVRLGRGFSRARARLVVLDEPFRGLDREKRRVLLRRVRHFWQGATLLCITHDVGETCDFGRVLVIEGGRVVEDGPPAALAACPGSHYRALLDAEEAVRTGLWSGGRWRRLRLAEGRLLEGEAGGSL